MTRFKRWLMLVPILAVALIATASPLNPAPTAEAAVTSYAKYWAFCGSQIGFAGAGWASDPFSDPYAFQKAEAMAQSGMDATHGPCLPVPAGYTPAFPGTRYPNKTQMFASLWVNAHYCTANPAPGRVAQPGEPCPKVKTIIYDKDLWSANTTTRNNAVAFWAPHKAYIEAIDMGDEFDCRPTTSVYDSNTNFTGDQWAHYINRMTTVWNYITNVPSSGLAGIPAYSTHLPPNATPGYNCAQKARWEAPNAWSNLGFDNYNVADSHWFANWYQNNLGTPSPNMVCAISVMQDAPGHGNVPSTITGTSIASAVGGHRYYGCDTMLWFNPGSSKAPAPFNGYKSLSNATAPFARSDWGASAVWNKNYTW